jgi:hypothetical protein
LALIREMYISALGKIPLSESILASGAPRTARDLLPRSSVTNSAPLPCSNPGAGRGGEAPSCQGREGQRHDERLGWLRVGGRGERSPRLRATRVHVKVQRVLSLLPPPQLGYEREARKAGGPMNLPPAFPIQAPPFHPLPGSRSAGRRYRLFLHGGFERNRTSKKDEI